MLSAQYWPFCLSLDVKHVTLVIITRTTILVPYLNQYISMISFHQIYTKGLVSL